MGTAPIAVVGRIASVVAVGSIASNVGSTAPVAVAGRIASVVAVAPVSLVPHNLSSLPKDILNEIGLWTPNALSSPLWLNFKPLRFFLDVVGVLLGAAQVRQQGGGDAPRVELGQFI